MKVAILYGLTALVTGLHNYYLLTDVVNGAPINPLNCSALLGSLILCATAALLPSHPRAARRIGLAASVLLWAFYGPLIIVSFFKPFSTWYELRFDAEFREFIPVVGFIIGPLLLILSTAKLMQSIRLRS